MVRLSSVLVARLVAAVAFVIGVWAVSPARAQEREQEEISPSCQDDRGVDRCAAEQHRRVLDLFGMKPIEEHERAGDQVRRVFYVDGYGRDMVGIAFTRPPGGDPMVTVHFKEVDGVRPPPATALVPKDVWEEVLRRSVYFERSFAPVSPPAREDGVISMCLHSWVYTVEATDPRTETRAPATRRKVEDACDDGPAEVFANDVARLTVPLLPYCDALDPRQHRNDASRLTSCAMLGGDRMAAAAAFGVAMKLFNLGGDSNETEARGIFDYEATLTWPDNTASTRGSATRDWIARTTGANRANFYISRVVGERADRARIEGVLVRYDTATGENESRASVTLTVTGTDGSYASVKEGRIGPFEPLPR